ncbi:hypothetical protein NLJ89_g1621 [Agrocybe chaxingu]|uniref:Protein kinase domain-containing protein n=1 Tax=Agrocybe chaxingu TaxID=84603 RepID=A0A9W8MZN3_9AGAR|nr:hypothetical protein NLJ89_g1621 [Agrocybe chaxingu]
MEQTDASEDTFRNVLNGMLAYQMPGGMEQWHLEAEFVPKFPLTFLDYHMDSNLALRYVKSLPNISQYLAAVAREAAVKFASKNFRHHPNDNYPAPSSARPSTFRDAETVFRNYYKCVGQTALMYASKFYFIPRDPTWHSLFFMERDDWDSENETFSVIVSEGFSVSRNSIGSLPPTHSLRVNLKGDSLAQLQDARTRYPYFAIWNFFTMSAPAKALLKKMRATSRLETKSRTVGYPLNLDQHEYPIDATTGIHAEISAFEADKYSLRSRASTRQESLSRPDSCPILRGSDLQATAAIDTAPSAAAKKKNAQHPPVVVAARPKRLGPYVPRHHDFLQYAWNRAVENDATYIVFHCGCYERIGVRHRASQTLYLSDLIYPVYGWDPAYGTLQLGLHLSIVQDVLERESTAKMCERRLRSSRKRTRGHDHDDDSTGNHIAKRQKTDDQVTYLKTGFASPTSSNINDELAVRDLALFILDYGPYRSTAPSSFLRTAPSCAPCSLDIKDEEFTAPTRQAKYFPTQYLSITISSAAVGHGAIGTVHRATAEVGLSSGERLKKTVIVKFASSPEHQERLTHEHQIYRHLAKARDVEGVVLVHGLFQDIETQLLALVMDDAGTTLRKREYARSGEGATVTTNTEEKRAFMKAIRSIHRTRVRHRDIRPDNVTVNDQGKVFFIDFDRAQIDVESRTTKSFDNEVKHMKRVLTGRTEDGDYSRYSDSEAEYVVEGEGSP